MAAGIGETAIGDDRPARDPAGHDAQRELERRALRNVRGLVERMQSDEASRRRSDRWIVAFLLGIVAFLVLMGLILAWSQDDERSEVREVRTPAAQVPPPGR